jgi:RNA polymerase sigma factor for flagellar operon FliA
MNARAYAKTAPSRSPERERLIVEHLDMARRIAQRVGRRVPSDIREEDLVSSAMIGLTEAADRFDDSRGEPFVAFAEKRIRGAVLDELRKGDIMPRRMRQAARKVGQTVRELSAKLGREPEDEEVARALGVSLEEYLTDLEGLTHVSAVDLDTAQTADKMASNDAGPDAATERRFLVERVQKALKTLPERDAIVMSLYYLEELSYAEIGKMIGVTESRVCQIHSRCISRLRAELTPDGEEN